MSSRVSPTSELPRDAYLDALRGMAILGVVAVHVSQAISGLPSIWQRFLSHGQFGVQLFFVVSAFTLCQSADRSGGASGFAAGRFFARRFFRITPAYWLAIAFYAVFAVHGHLYEDWRSRLAVSLLYLNYLQPKWIFSGLPPGGWSIVAEVFFYLLFPFLYLHLRTSTRSLLLIALLVSTTVLFGHLAAKPELAEGFFSRIVASITSRFGIVTQLPAFCCGFLAVRTTDLLLYNRTCSLLAVALILLACFIEVVPDSLEIVCFGLLFALLLKALKHRPLPILVNRFLTKVGEVSFSIYLVHFAVISLLVRRWPTPLVGFRGFCVFASSVLLLSIPLAIFNYHFLEKPFISLGRRLTHANPKHHVACA